MKEERKEGRKDGRKEASKEGRKKQFAEFQGFGNGASVKSTGTHRESCIKFSA
jgi:hypothetical protein